MKDRVGIMMTDPPIPNKPPSVPATSPRPSRKRISILHILAVTREVTQHAGVEDREHYDGSMEFWHVVGDITILLGVAVLLGIIAERLGISGVVGYLLAGTLVGPGLLNWVTSDEETIRVIAEIGVALLLFTIGLEINGRRLRELLGRGMAMGVLQILVTGSIGYALAILFGTTPKAAIIVGAMLALSSTAVVVRVLQDRSELDAVHGRLSLSVLLVQDLAIVPIMLLI
ncbi:MAG TPA: cation:proton antiporter [Phycisphaerales bacterium]|nr:cation:proton antiporter [Phycisphaerales bacterium]